MRRYKAAILGYYGFGNLGDELLLQACLEILEKHGIEREKIIVLSNNPSETSENFHVDSVNRWKFREVSAAFRESEKLILGGGGLFQDSSSIKSCIWYWYIVRLAKFLGLKIFALGQSIGPLNSKISEIFTANALKLCEKIHVRDENSFETAKKFGCKNVLLGCDLVMTLANSGSVNHISKSKKLLINLRPCPELEKFISVIAPNIKNFFGEKIGVALSHDDEKVLNDAKEILALNKIILIKNFNEAEILWAEASCAVGMRLHFGVLSRIFGTPLALMPYDVKVSEFAKQSGVPCINEKWVEPSKPIAVPNEAVLLKIMQPLH